jgi:probable HAF family extracellular repeat protein
VWKTDKKDGIKDKTSEQQKEDINQSHHHSLKPRPLNRVRSKQVPRPRLLLISSLFYFCFSPASMTSVRATEYSLIEIPPPLIHAAGLNNNGDVVGDAGPSTEGLLRGTFVYHHHDGTITQLPCQGARCRADALGIDDHEDVIGSSDFGLRTSITATIWLANGGVTVFENAFFSMGAGVNNHGRAVWNDTDMHGIMSGVVSDLQGQIQFGLPSLLQCGFGFCEAQSGGNAINDQGHAVGWSNWGAEPPPSPGAGQISSGTHAVLWVNGTPTDLGALGDNTFASANGVNNFDAVVGNSTVGGAPHAFLYSKGKMTDLGNLAQDPLLSSDADAINDRGEIVGWSDVRLDADHSITQRAFLIRHGQMKNLTFLLHPQVWAKIRLTEATAINCHGWIAADGFEAATGTKHAYLLLPRNIHRSQCPHEH